MEESERIALGEFVQELEQYKGRHTELISVYVPAGYSLNAVAKQLEQEKGTASNIKGKNTRKNVIDALERLTRQLKLYKETPKNGMAIFSGNISKEEGQQDIKIWTLEPPLPLKIKLYRCDQEFVLDALKEMLQAKHVYGLIIIDRDEATIGLLEGKSITKLKHLTSGVPGKQKAGGQSSQRFERVTENLVTTFYRRVADSLKGQFFEMPRLKGILLGGPGYAKDDFMKEGQLVTALRKKIVAVKDIGYADENGLKLLVNASSEELAKEEIMEEKNLVKDFLTLLASSPEKVCYGLERTRRALENGAVGELLISSRIEKKLRAELERMASSISASFHLVSEETEEGRQFSNFAVAAILRFSVE